MRAIIDQSIVVFWFYVLPFTGWLTFYYVRKKNFVPWFATAIRLTGVFMFGWALTGLFRHYESEKLVQWGIAWPVYRIHYGFGGAFLGLVLFVFCARKAQWRISRTVTTRQP
jgi:hypothetical protein